MELNLSNQYDHKALVRYGVWAVLCMLAMKATGGYASVCLIFAALFALMNRKAITLLYIVLYLTLIGMSNEKMFGNRVVSVLVARVVLVSLTALVAGKVFNARSSRCMMPIWGIMVYTIWECVVSLQGYQPIVSYLKLVLFFCIFLSMFGVANEVNASTRVNAKILRAAILAIVALITLGSVAVMPFPSISLMTGKAALEAMKSGEVVSLFCGVCAHSQAMGPLAGVLGTFLLADLVFSIKKWDKFYVAMLVSCAIICYKSSSRTGMGTFVAGCGMVTFLFLRARGIGTNWRGKVMTAATLVVMAGGIAVVALPQMRERVAKFALKTVGGKDERKDLTVENMFSSRQQLIDESMRNFRKKPFQGNGFQVSEEMQFQKRSGWKSYLAAPIEKGVWFYAVLEEGGIVGFVLFAGWLLILFPTLYKRGAYVMASTFFAFIMANTGEFCLFAMSYVGGFYWTLTFAAGTLDVQRLKNQGEKFIWEVPIDQVIAEVGMDEWVRVRG